MRARFPPIGVVSYLLWQTCFATLFLAFSLAMLSLESGGQFWMGLCTFALLLALSISRSSVLLPSPTIAMRVKVGKRDPTKANPPVVHWKGVEYVFSARSGVQFIITVPLVILLLVFFFDLSINLWLQELVAKQTSFVANLFFDARARATYDPARNFPWSIVIGGTGTILGIESTCTAAPIYAIITGIVLFIPKNRGHSDHNDLSWRKGKTIFFVVAVIYSINLLRITSLVYSDYFGLLQETHEFLLPLTGILAAILLAASLVKWVPEFFAFILYICAISKCYFSKRKVRK
ncbi:MAG: hypothetical protein RBG13Loki_4146 [Promethearchaeota archaeon CR_4]|nr:MAG: hypothetical protein RBG13Loki_4146 [Candidatus Lokiarchaeota archaeon CR_4]